MKFKVSDILTSIERDSDLREGVGIWDEDSAIWIEYGYYCSADLKSFIRAIGMTDLFPVVKVIIFI
jgi:hypothetical protein